MKRTTLFLTCALIVPALYSAGAQSMPAPMTVPGDARPDAPELAARGQYAVGVRTLNLVNKGQQDIVHAPKEGAIPTYDRPLTVEVWYPAPGVSGSGSVKYMDVLGSGPGDPKRPNTPFETMGRATRDASAVQAGPFPLVILSHGYPGSRILMSYLGENLASKGYIVASIDHTDATHGDKAAFASTLVNRALDDNFVISEMARQGMAGSGSFLSNVVNAEQTGIVGYSMGGYGALNAAGAGFGAEVLPLVPGGALAARQTGAFQTDGRIRAVVALAPWGGDAARRAAGIPVGGEFGFWDAAGLAGLRVPTLFIAGEHDDVSGFDGGVKALFQNTVNADRSLLVYRSARHNIAANPAPATANPVSADDYLRYAEPAWDTARINNINQHFVTAFLNLHLKGETGAATYLNVPTPVASDAAADAPWPGFPPRTAIGIELHQLKAGEQQS
ncbi:dienelactone hydrolase [Deinococcus sp.]|uniref:alpha/beta hydrolase family protein n=1 Tax=Deinococcus sp. TaxID=47478 RepID=UPI0028698101|nr:dienelactone hydrolase [Deinococcus sp.]